MHIFPSVGPPVPIEIATEIIEANKVLFIPTFVVEDSLHRRCRKEEVEDDASHLAPFCPFIFACSEQLGHRWVQSQRGRACRYPVELRRSKMAWPLFPATF